MSDYFQQCLVAQSLGSIRTANAPSLSQERREEINTELNVLFVDLNQQSPAEKIRRYLRMLELGGERGYVYDPDPGYDIYRIRAIRSWIAEEESKLTAE